MNKQLLIAIVVKRFFTSIYGFLYLLILIKTVVREDDKKLGQSNSYFYQLAHNVE